MCRNKAALVVLIGKKGKSANAVSAPADLPYVSLFIRQPTSYPMCGQ